MLRLPSVLVRRNYCIDQWAEFFLQQCQLRSEDANTVVCYTVPRHVTSQSAVNRQRDSEAAC